jgi:SAM-dependent methyltransferase
MAAQLANMEQARAWDGPEGDRWALQEERYDASTAAHTGHLLRAAAIRPNERVLDIGCGCGVTTWRAAAQTRGQVVGVDLSERMLTRARQRATPNGADHVTFVQADAQVHQFDAGAFDVVISKFGATFFADPITAFTNIGDAVRPGGRLLMLTWGELRANPWVMEIRTALAAGRELPYPPAHAAGPFGLADPDYIHSVLGQAGWRSVRLTEIAEPVHFGDDVDDAFAFVSQMGFTLGLLNGLDSATRDLSLKRLRHALDAAMTGGSVSLPAQAWLVQAQRA